VTLAATLTMLALHQDIQEEVLLQILDVVGQEREPVCPESRSSLLFPSLMPLAISGIRRFPQIK
jgi:hypothetical protein